jgi:nitroreductase
MDVFEAVNSRFACRRFLDKHVDPDIVRTLVESAAHAASSSNLQPWNVYAVTGGPLKEIKRRRSSEGIGERSKPNIQICQIICGIPTSAVGSYWAPSYMVRWASTETTGVQGLRDEAKFSIFHCAGRSFHHD